MTKKDRCVPPEPFCNNIIQLLCSKDETFSCCISVSGGVPGGLSGSSNLRNGCCLQHDPFFGLPFRLGEF
jgi:hypothetical protein